MSASLSHATPACVETVIMNWILDIGSITEKCLEVGSQYMIAVLHMLSEIFDAFAVDYNSFLATY